MTTTASTRSKHPDNARTHIVRRVTKDIETLTLTLPSPYRTLTHLSPAYTRSKHTDNAHTHVVRRGTKGLETLCRLCCERHRSTAFGCCAYKKENTKWTKLRYVHEMQRCI